MGSPNLAQTLPTILPYRLKHLSVSMAPHRQKCFRQLDRIVRLTLLARQSLAEALNSKPKRKREKTQDLDQSE